MSEHSGSDSDEGPPPQSPLDLYQFNNRIQTRRQATHARDAKSTVNVKTFLLCRARASRGSAFGSVPDAICRLIAAIAGGCFVPADGFRGRREGCVFKLGGRGLGYYPDFAALEQARTKLRLAEERLAEQSGALESSRERLRRAEGGLRASYAAARRI